MKYKIGDKVKIIKPKGDCKEYRGRSGEITERFDIFNAWQVKFRDGGFNNFKASELSPLPEVKKEKKHISGLPRAKKETEKHRKERESLIRRMIKDAKSPTRRKGKMCPKTLSGKHIWGEIKHPTYELNRSSGSECQACGMIDDTKENNG